MITNATGIFCLLIVLCAVVFVVAGEKLFTKISHVREFNEVAALFRRTQISGSKFGKQPLSIQIAASKPLNDLRSGTLPDVEPYLHFPFGNVVEIAYVRDRRQRAFVRELKAYCGILSFLFVVAVLNFARAKNWEIGFLELVHDIGEKPLEFVGFLEILMIGIILFRLVFEVWELAELIEVTDKHR